MLINIFYFKTENGSTKFNIKKVLYSNKNQKNTTATSFMQLAKQKTKIANVQLDTITIEAEHKLKYLENQIKNKI